MLSCMDWKLWPERGFGALGPLTAYIDFSPLPSGAIRCVGPFSTGDSCQHEALSAMRALTVEIENNYLEDNQFVLWGAYADRAEYQEHEIEISGTTCGFVPAVWVRTHLLGTEDASVDREWTRSADGLVHRSGLALPNTGSSVVDSAVFHPHTAELALVKLCGMWEHVLGSDKNSLRLPVFRWTPVRIAERAS